MNRAEYRADVLRYDGVGAALRTIISDVEHGIDRITRHQTTAAQAAASTTTEDRMSAIAVIEEGWNSVKGEVAKLEQAMPGALEKAKQFEASPFAQLAEKVAGTVLPPEAVAIAVGAAEKVLDDLISLYAPQQPAQPVQ